MQQQQAECKWVTIHTAVATATTAAAAAASARFVFRDYHVIRYDIGNPNWNIIVPILSPAQVWWLVVVFATPRRFTGDSMLQRAPVTLSVPAQRAVRVPTDTRRPFRQARRGEIFRTFGMLLDYTWYQVHTCWLNPCGWSHCWRKHKDSWA